MMNKIETHTGFVTAGATKLAYEQAGTGEAVVLLHAGVADQRMWDEQFLALARHYRVLRYDRRGFGQSSPVADPFAHHADLAALLTGLNIEQAHLVGCSAGGEVALDFALVYPARVLSLSLVSSSIGGFVPSGEPPQRVLALFGALQQGDFDQAAELAAQIWLDGPQRSAAQTSPQVRERLQEMARDALPNFLLDPTLVQALEPSATTRLAEVHCPTLVLVGTLDDPLIETMAEHLLADIPAARKVVMSDTAHFPNLENPNEFNRNLLDFLAQQ